MSEAIRPATLNFIENQHNAGKGFSLRRGVEASSARFQVYTDIDFPYEIASMTSMIGILKDEKADVIAGSRDTKYYSGVPPFRRFISRALRGVLRHVLRMKITDTQAGLKGFGSRGKEIFLRTRINRFLFDLEFIFLASRESGLTLLPFPVSLRPGTRFSKMRPGIFIHEGFNFLIIFAKMLVSRFSKRQ